MINIANALPQVVAPVLAGVLLYVVEASGGLVESDGSGFSVGYFAVYFLAFASSVLGSVFVTRIRGVRLTGAGNGPLPFRVLDLRDTSR